MTAADLSVIFQALTPAESNSELQGREMPSLAPDGVWSRTIPTECSGCWKAASTHKVCNGVGFGPAAAAKAILEKLIDPSNDVRERTRVWRSLIQLMHLGVHGIYDTELPVGRDNAVIACTWPVASVSGGTIGLRFAAGTPDPRAISWTVQVLDPLYPSPGHESQYLTQTVTRALKARGMLTFGYPSMLRNFTQGWPVQRVYVPSGFGAVDSVFYLILEGDFDGSAALEEYPEDTGVGVSATYRVYAEAADEPWARVRDCYPFLAVEKRLTISSPSNFLMTLEYSKRIRKPSSGWFYAYDQAGNVLDLAGRIYIAQSAGGWQTMLDLATFDLTGITSILLVYWVESTAAGAVNVGQNRCKWSHYDPTHSWGKLDSANRLHYCAKREALRGQQWDTNYRAECYQINCPYFEEDSPSDPLAAIAQLIYSYPWREEQVAVGSTDTVLYRHGTPSLESLTNTLMSPPDGLFRRKIFTGQAGGWERMAVYNGRVTGYPGLEMLRNNSAETAIDINNASSWPDFGPGGDRVDGRRTDYGDDAADGTTDPHKLERQTMVIGGLDLDPYAGTTSGTLGKRQRIGVRRSRVYLPALGAGSPATRADGTVYRGLWDAKLQPCDEADAVWRARIVLSPPMWTAFGGAVRTATIATASWDGAKLICELDNGILSATSPIESGGDLVESTTSWRQGGTNVAPLEGWRVWNYACGQTRHGPMRGLIHRGHVARFNGEAFAGYAIFGRALWISHAKAFEGSAGSWKADILTGGTEAEYYAGNVTLHGAGLPWNHQTWANRRDVIHITDSAGIVADFIAAEGIGPIIGTQIAVSDDGIALEGGTIYTSSRANPAPDAEESGARFLGAQGEVWLENLDTADACVIADAYFAERDCVGSVREIEAIDKAFEHIAGE